MLDQEMNVFEETDGVFEAQENAENISEEVTENVNAATHEEAVSEEKVEVPATEPEEVNEEKSEDAEPSPAETLLSDEEEIAEEIKAAAGKSNLIGMVGNVSKNVIAQGNDVSDEIQAYTGLKKSLDNQDILWGIVDGVTPLKSSKTVVISVVWNKVRIFINEKNYFEKSFSFGKDFENMNDTLKLRRKVSRINAQLGALVPFIVNDIQTVNGKIQVTASRSAAMSKLRDIYFIHKNTDHPVDVKPGDEVAEAHVITATPFWALVECLGVETRMDAYALSHTRIENCADYVKPGDKLRGVRIVKIHINEGDDVYLTLNARVRANRDRIASLTPGSQHLGEIVSYNRKKQYYKVVLADGVEVAVKQKMTGTDEELSGGTPVIVKVLFIGKDNLYVVGSLHRR